MPDISKKSINDQTFKTRLLIAGFFLFGLGSAATTWVSNAPEHSQPQALAQGAHEVLAAASSVDTSKIAEPAEQAESAAAQNAVFEEPLPHPLQEPAIRSALENTAMTAGNTSVDANTQVSTKNDDAAKSSVEPQDPASQVKPLPDISAAKTPAEPAKSGALTPKPDKAPGSQRLPKPAVSANAVSNRTTESSQNVANKKVTSAEVRPAQSKSPPIQTTRAVERTQDSSAPKGKILEANSGRVWVQLDEKTTKVYSRGDEVPGYGIFTGSHGKEVYFGDKTYVLNKE